ncbi:MAG TPA: hypothetical protein VHT91_48040 [Kofleriaceae bacterium]|nr:hypothetical protein [Kofleriaceae bacterium]
MALAMPACRAGASDGPPGLAEAPAAALSQLPSTQQAKLLASDGTDFDTFGSSVALAGDTALVGANRNDERGTDAGAAYVFARSGASWTQQTKLTAADGAGNENFGTSVAVEGDTALVGAIFASDAGSSDFGAVYVFVRSGTTWTQQAKLVPPDGVADDQFGTSIALSGDTAVIGAVHHSAGGDRSGAAYVFVRSGATWVLQAQLTAADGADNDQLGMSVALAGDTAVIGAVNAAGHTAQAGAAYVFVRSGTTWTQQAKLTAADGAAFDHFGTSVALSSDTVLVGASGSDDVDHDAGAAYVFVRSGATWTQQAELTAADGEGGNAFGAAVALAGDTAVIGSPFDSPLGAASGSSYVFARSGTTWTQQTKLTAADGTAVDFFGTSVALSGSSALSGAPGRDDLGSSSGAAYVFAPAQSGNGEACATGATCASGFCADGVCCDTACGGGDPGDCQACSVAAGAAVDGTCAPRAAGTVCRGAAGACDVAEACTGTSPACPADAFASHGTTCRPAAGACDAAEACTGSSAACPADQLASAGTVCRPAAGACDAAETCTGGSPACPADQLAAAGTVCRSATGACDAAEACTGSSAACPADHLAPAGAVCRPAVGSCDLAERCSGSVAGCPRDAFKPDLSLCFDGLLGLPGVCLAGHCLL